MDKLIIKNFGPINDISIDIKDINIFIGPTSSGKSVVAKLIAIFTSPLFIQNSYFIQFEELLRSYNIEFAFHEDTEIIYYSHNCYWHIRNKKLEVDNNTNVDINKIISFDVFNNLYAKSRGNMSAQEWIIWSMNNLSPEKKIEIFSDEKENSIDMLKAAILNQYIQSKEYFSLFNPVYFPAERIFISSVAETLFELVKYNISLTESIKDFGSKFEVARKNINSLNVSFLQAQYQYSDRNNYIILENGEKIKLEVASSGLQSCIPLMIVLEYYSNIKRIIDYCFVVEEPELNLYPTMQKSLLEFIVSKVSKTNDRLVLTTHSPYILTAIDNLIQAKNAFGKHPELKKEINDVVPEELWVDFNKVSCYYFDKGYCRSTLDNEMQSIGASNIDDVSIQLGETFDRLMDLKYHD
jgi:hypothetical protein